MTASLSAMLRVKSLLRRLLGTSGSRRQGFDRKKDSIENRYRRLRGLGPCAVILLVAC
jgi:hypothetical protein